MGKRSLAVTHVWGTSITSHNSGICGSDHNTFGDPGTHRTEAVTGHVDTLDRHRVRARIDHHKLRSHLAHTWNNTHTHTHMDACTHTHTNTRATSVHMGEGETGKGALYRIGMEGP